MKKTYLFCFENDQEKMLTELKKKVYENYLIFQCERKT